MIRRTLIVSLSICFAIATTCFLSPKACGALIVGFDSSSYQGVAGGTVNVTLQLEVTDDSATGGADHTVLLSNGGANGLFSIGVFIMNDNLADAGSDGADVLATTDISVNATDFGDTTLAGLTPVGPGVAGIRAVSNDFVEGVQVGTTGPFVVDIATFTYTLGPELGEVTTLSLADFPGGLADTVDTALVPNVYDSIIDFSATATITAVPEPSAMFVLAGLAMGCVVRRRRARLFP